MSKYKTTKRYTHLKELPDHLKVGMKVKKGDYVGTMGATGDSTTDVHYHLDAVKGAVRGVWRSSQVRTGQFILDHIGMARMITHGLMDKPFTVSNYPHGHTYFLNVGYHHEGYDLVTIDPVTGKYTFEEDTRMYWPLDEEGEILSIGWDKTGYGFYINILNLEGK